MQFVFSRRQKFAGAAAFDGTLAHPFPQLANRLVIEAADTEMAANTQRLFPFGLGTPRTVKKQHRCQSKLAGQMVYDLDRCVPVVVDKPAMSTQETKL